MKMLHISINMSCWKYVPNYSGAGAALCPLNQLQSIINMQDGNMFFNFSGPLMSQNLNILHLQGINRGQQPGKRQIKGHNEQQLGSTKKYIVICSFFSFLDERG